MANILFSRKVKWPRTQEQINSGYKDTYEIVIPERYIIEENIVKLRPSRKVVVSEGDILDWNLLTCSKVIRDEAGRMIWVEEYTPNSRPNTISTSRAITLEITVPWGYEIIGDLYIA